MLVQFLFVARLPLSISSRPKWIQMLSKWSPARCTMHRTRRQQKPALRPGNRLDATALSRNGYVEAWLSCLMWGNSFAFCCRFFLLIFWLYIRGSGGARWCSDIWMSLCCSALACALHKAYLSFPLFLTQHAQTHSHGQLPFNSQLGVRKLECWGELHKKNINVNKKTGTCFAMSCHPKKKLS